MKIINIQIGMCKNKGWWPKDIKNQHAEIQKNAQIREKKINRKEIKI